MERVQVGEEGRGSTVNPESGRRTNCLLGPSRVGSMDRPMSGKETMVRLECGTTDTSNNMYRVKNERTLGSGCRTVDF